MLMLEHKGIPYRTVTLPSGFHAGLVRMRGFPGKTVPALRLDGERVQTNPKIARFLDHLQPEPRLFPADPERREQVEAAERWADEVFQMAARRLTLAGTLNGPDGLIARAGAGRLGPILWRHDTTRFLGARAVGRFVFDINPTTAQELRDAAPGLLDRIDAWIEAGVLNGEHLNAADFEIAPSAALFTYRADLRAELDGRPVTKLIDRLLPKP
jgi:glutathione S-transferase